MHNSVIYTARHEMSATTVRLLPLSASRTATISPITAEYILAVAENIAGIVIAVRTAYGI
jgi:hypothetical protein